MGSNQHLVDRHWPQLIPLVVAAEDSLARLDERILKSPLKEGWIARTHYMEAHASLWLEGESVSLEDLILHDARMDVRGPTHELTKAHAILRARRRVDRLKFDWPPTPQTFGEITGRHFVVGTKGRLPELPPAIDDLSDDDILGPAIEDLEEAELDPPGSFETFGTAEGRHLVYDEDWHEASRVGDWLSIIGTTDKYPPVLAAALAEDAWNLIDPLQHAYGMGRLMAAAMLKARGKTRSHLALLSSGLRKIPREDRRSRDPIQRHAAVLRAFHEAALDGLRNHETWAAAKLVLERKLRGRRSTSKLPELIDLLIARPLVSTGLVAAELGVSPRAAQNLVGELGVREITGRGRFRAWSIM
jgi:hypothetical protein